MVRQSLCPEVFWLVVCGAMYALARTNAPPTEAGSQALEKWWFVLPFALTPLTFLAYALPHLRARPWWLLLRVNLAAGIGIVFASYVITEAIDYQDSRNAGVPMGWMMSVLFGWFVEFFATIFAVPVIAWKTRRRAVRMSGPPAPPTPQ
ncbi:MAG: hypothetical protein FJY92_06760 [Candidatus Hydrogenedentes bacterium]|nr:hypothetical protein [Candidatus Hydrogenedentota bacterium]